ncbi:hypothetical protein FVB32_08075 [Flagellimonas hymeniacidonis]|uniref:HEAT repeat domain-containing protein n=1 Tax=Flagellimonas hymeniacidonis TaxID=2603628 RepID=A0A5C8VBQ3_9FLAO|nr:hypothetical protein [Flagellimonas hymeniacidonis]TXN38238.1 hypothetical protein FVB32_08075 [Flagellimonas hymeniacidonis]
MKIPLDVLSKIASALNRRDEVPNQELAKEIIADEDRQAIQILIEHLSHKNKAIQNDCIKVIYEIGESRPDLIVSYFEIFLEMLGSKNNRLQWGVMTALNYIAHLKPQETFHHLPRILETAEKGSVITRDHAINIIITLANTEKYRTEAFALLREQLLGSPINQFAMYAERTVPVVDKDNKEQFIKILETRMQDLQKESQKKRVEKIIRKLS